MLLAVNKSAYLPDARAYMPIRKVGIMAHVKKAIAADRSQKSHISRSQAAVLT